MKVLAISPHTDDAELGCGGYLHKLKEEGCEIIMATFSINFHGHSLKDEWEESASMVSSKLEEGDFTVREFGKDRQAILQIMIDLKEYYHPDLVLIPSGADIHQDHVVIHNEAVRAYSRDCSVLAYELPWNARAFKPNYYVELSPKHLAGKKRMTECYKSQADRNYFDWPFLDGLARMRGRQIEKEFAEALEVITLIK